MTHSAVNTFDPAYENMSLEACLKLPIDKSITLFEGLQNPHLVMPKIKFDYRLLSSVDLVFGGYQTFLYGADYAKGEHCFGKSFRWIPY